MLRRLVAGQAVVAIVVGVLLAAPATAASKPPKPTKPAAPKVSTCGDDPVGDGIAEQVGPVTDHPAEDIVTASVKRSGSNVVVEDHLAADLPAGAAPRARRLRRAALVVDTATDTKGVRRGHPPDRRGAEEGGVEGLRVRLGREHQTDLTVAPVVNGSTITFTVPKSSVPNLGKTFFWHAGTEAAATPLGSTLYDDRCPGGGGFDAPDTEWTRSGA
ncbi:MAG: hypothetical protein U0W40_17195 [Acidimicrobiia bacterium]